MNPMSREDPQFYNAYELPWRSASGEHEILHGLDARLLSKNRRTGASTWMARLPAGWRTSIKADQDTVETFVLEGDLTINDRKIGSTGFAGIPQWTGPVRLASDGGAAVYLFITPDLPLPAYTSGIKVTDPGMSVADDRHDRCAPRDHVQVASHARSRAGRDPWRPRRIPAHDAMHTRLHGAEA